MHRFEPLDGLTLSVRGLSASAVVVSCGDHHAEVDVEGDPDWIGSLTITYDAPTNRLTVSEPGGMSGCSTVQINSFSGDGYPSVTSGAGVFIGNAAGRVIVNGVDVTAQLAACGAATPTDPKENHRPCPGRDEHRSRALRRHGSYRYPWPDTGEPVMRCSTQCRAGIRREDDPLRRVQGGYHAFLGAP
jgi:hypothetical protein